MQNYLLSRKQCKMYNYKLIIVAVFLLITQVLSAQNYHDRGGGEEPQSWSEILFGIATTIFLLWLVNKESGSKKK